MTSYKIGIYEKAMPGFLNWKEKLLAAKNTGYDYLEISIDETDAKLARLSAESPERQQIKLAVTETELPVRSMCLSGHRKYPLGSLSPETRTRGLEIMESALQLADELGIRTIQLAGYDVYYEETSEDTRKYFQENLAKAVEMASYYGISMGFETMETEFMNTVEKAMKYVTLIDSPYLGVYPDIGNITNAAISYGKSVLDDLETGHGHLVALHLKETVPGIFREVPFGTGHVDFEAAIAKAWSLGVRRYVTEFWYLDGHDWQTEQQQAIQMMRSILDKQLENKEGE